MTTTDIKQILKEGECIPKIIDAWKEAHWNAPTLEDRLTTEEVRLALPIPIETNTNVTDNVPDSTKNVPDSLLVELTDRQKVIYNILKSNIPNNVPDNAENVPDSAPDNVTETLTETAESLASKLSVSTKTIKRDLKRMKELGIIKREGGDFGGRWVVCL